MDENISILEEILDKLIDKLIDTDKFRVMEFTIRKLLTDFSKDRNVTVQKYSDDCDYLQGTGLQWKTKQYFDFDKHSMITGPKAIEYQKETEAKIDELRDKLLELISCFNVRQFSFKSNIGFAGFLEFSFDVYEKNTT